MEKIINKFLEIYLGDDIYIKKLDVFCSSPVEVNYYFFSKDNILYFEIVRRGDKLEFPRKSFSNLIESYLGFDSETSFPYLCEWFSKKQQFLDLLKNN